MANEEHHDDEVTVDDTGQEGFEEEAEMFEEDADQVIEKLIAQRDEYLDQLQRSRAEFINYRKRTDAEKLRLGEMFTASTIGKILPVIDDWDRAMAAVPENEHDDGWFQGILMIQQKFAALLAGFGVQEVEALNAAFDPSIHEAVSTDPGSTGEYVTEVYQKGYKLGETLLRPAMVKTGNAPAA